MRKKQIVILGVVMGSALLGLLFTQIKYFQTAFKLEKAQFDYLVNRSIDQIMNSVDVINQKLAEEDAKGEQSAYIRQQNGIGGLVFNPSMLKENMDIVMGYPNTSLPFDNKTAVGEEIFGNKGNRSLLNSIEKSRQVLKESLGKEYDLVVTKQDDAWKSRSMETLLKHLNLEEMIKKCLQENGLDIPFEYAVQEKGEFILTSSHFFGGSSDYSYSRKLALEEFSGVATLFLVFPDEKHDLVSSILLLLPSLLITLLLVACFFLCIREIVKQKKLSAIKNDFINNMTHEFKTPIATISLAAQMLKDGAVTYDPPAIGRIAGIIRDESKRLTFQVEKVLQSALFTESRMKLKLKNLHLNEVVESLASKFSLRVEDKGGTLHTYLDADQDEVCADEVHITNVVSNLLDNAIKYCNREPEITICTSNRGEEIIISVIDNGIGIAVKEQKLIFERFYRVSTGNLHDVKGFGLGLSYVKTIVEAHGGRIEVKSEEGKGSRFDVFLPLTVKKQKVKRTLFF